MLCVPTLLINPDKEVPRCTMKSVAVSINAALSALLLISHVTGSRLSLRTAVSVLRAQVTTTAPLSTKLSTTARPIPLVPPVTKNPRPASCDAMLKAIPSLSDDCARARACDWYKTEQRSGGMCA